MTSKEKMFVVMYAPSDDYSTENATVKVTARSVDGDAPSAGFGLMVHCAHVESKAARRLCVADLSVRPSRSMKSLSTRTAFSRRS